MKNKNIPIKAAKLIAKEYSFPQIVIYAYDPETNKQHITTYGNTVEDCANAAKCGNYLKKIFGWPKELCNAIPRRVKKQLDEQK